jgi:hypothetical protein
MSRPLAGGAPNMWFNQVPEPKTAKNRLHLDLRAPADMAEEVTRLEALGATVVRGDAALTVVASSTPLRERRRATSMPERAENCGHQRSPAGTVNGLRSGQAQVDPLRETTF